MRILVVNTGSSSVQLQLVVTGAAHASADDAKVELAAKVESLKGDAHLVVDGKRRPAKARQHAEGAREILDTLGESLREVHAVVHRLVHGGARYREPVRIDEEVMAAIRDLETLAPLHNSVAREVIEALRERLPDVPHVAVFDTSFHARLPEQAFTYAIAPELARAYGIRRYGFHGTAYRYMANRYAKLRENGSTRPAKVVAVHLGGGCSVAAIDGDHSVETSMGMTPLEGLVMGTRAGDIDPGIIELLATRENKSAAEVVDLLNRAGGLKALSGLTEDTRVLVEEMATNPRAALALEVFCHRIVKYVGAYLAVLDGAEALLLGGVINENTPWVRERVCRQFAWCGLELDAGRNADTIDREGRISTDTSRLHAWVIPAREDLQLAFEAACLIEGTRT